MITMTPIPTDFSPDLNTWLVRQADQYHLTWLLAYADDGVIWGRLEDGVLLLSSGRKSAQDKTSVSPHLLLETLQQVRLFGAKGELMAWKDADTWQARLVEEDSDPVECIDQPQILWGTEVADTDDQFTLLTESAQSGMRHIVPLKVNLEQVQARRLKLLVRHYVDFSKDGEARVRLSRLVNISLDAAQAAEVEQ